MSVTWTGDELAQEQTRRTSNRALALAALVAAGDAGLTNIELMTVAGTRAGGRVHELRAEGYAIDCERIDGGLYRYTLRARPAATTTDRWPVLEHNREGMLF
jgi:hypothetical protein